MSNGSVRPDEGPIEARQVAVPVSAADVVAAADAAAAEVIPEPPPLDDRKLKILRAIVTEYVADGEPVGSRRVVEVARLDVSAATVRNDMAVLEELGYITQPHTSAGRVPTDQGYRRFVDDLAANPALDAPKRELIGELLGSARDVEDLLARTSSVLSQLTRLVSLVIAPAVDASRCKLVELVGLSPQSALLLLVADTGRVEKRTIELPAGTTDGDLERVRTVLGEQVRGRPMGEVHAALRSVVEVSPSDLREVMRAVADATDVGLADDTVHHVVVGGRASLAGEAALERDDLSRILELLEERATLARILTDTEGDEPLVRIGGENTVEDLRATSLVAQRYRVVTAGSLGVLGPTRMDYASVLSTVRAVADELQRSLADLSG
ncbi:heat-inducible transcriptional repressor HrcA [Nitriliruptor alkaliphilus]|uniref:heat-inducible transcriptional repressor HrcA n=1 Tax=Nitriliruptor alkaliphilus TaxID=427918 RepID=UPI000695A696|nr:heat-inducible transcriptional repressor HrcA [Nitriliruptor alkaliphilus]